MKTKAQAAMEFLMSYGWAILVVMIAVGALSYFGVLDAGMILPESCTSSAGMDCTGKASITGNTVAFVVHNNQGYPVLVHDSLHSAPLVISSENCNLQSSVVECVEGDTSATHECSAQNDEKVKVIITCADDIEVGRFKADVTLPFDNTVTGLDHSAFVSITGKVS
ncbi:MAG: hypothetical protein ABIA37_01990 [Candidatus Woesearchaeota archaeon]